MSRLNAPSPSSNRPSANVYTGLAFISMIATLGAAAFFAWKCMELGIFN
jgi:hypothetical protein